MSILLPVYDVTRDSEIMQPTDFNLKSSLKHLDKTYKSEIINTITLTEMEKLFQIRIIDEGERERFSFLPGQFVMIEVPGYGEIPISISSTGSRKGYIEFCIRKAGGVTNILHKATRGARVGLRGPFGTFFPMEKMKGQNILLIAGGLGLAPLRAPIFYVLENRSEFNEVDIMYGARQPDQLLFSYQYEMWRRIGDINIQIIVENPDQDWKGPVGLITSLFDTMTINPENTYAIVCGPPVMFKFVCKRLNQIGIPMERMFVSLERRMHCGMGKCCRCNVGSTFTCLEGPVFDYWSVINLVEAI